MCETERNEDALAMFAAAATRRQHPAVPERETTDGDEGGGHEDTSADDVAVATTGSFLSYHDPRHLPSAQGMVLVEEREARRRGAVPCSQCFPAQESVQYPFAYVTGEHIALAGGQR